MNYYHHRHPFELESGRILPEITIAYHTYGTMNKVTGNVVWICHHLTANSDAALWWKGVVGAGALLDPGKNFIVCANIIGSCYGTTGPISVDPETLTPYYNEFPIVTIRDMVRAHMLLRKHLGIDEINLLIGGSMGGYQALEWCIMEKDVIRNLVLLSTSAAESAWGIAVHTAQRLAIEADCTWNLPSPDAGIKGLKAARAIGLVSYRNYGILVKKQTDPDIEKTDHFQASSYINYQGEKLASRFNAFSYWLLTKAMDSHQVARKRNSTSAAILKTFTQRTLIIGILSDILCPLPEQQFLADNLPYAALIIIDSVYGHDGFMVEAPVISSHISKWWQR